MSPAVRKSALVAHITFSLGWLGAAAGFEALAVTGLTSSNVQTVRAVYLAMQPITWFVIVPFAFASLLTGLTMAFGTKWGLFRHYWVFVKFLINTFAIVLLLLHTGIINEVAKAAIGNSLLGDELHGDKVQLVVAAGAAPLALLAATMLAVFKPRGLTPYGWRKQRRESQMPKVSDTQVSAALQQ